MAEWDLPEPEGRLPSLRAVDVFRGAHGPDEPTLCAWALFEAVDAEGAVLDTIRALWIERQAPAAGGGEPVWGLPRQDAFGGAGAGLWWTQTEMRQTLSSIAPPPTVPEENVPYLPQTWARRDLRVNGTAVFPGPDGLPLTPQLNWYVSSCFEPDGTESDHTGAAVLVLSKSSHTPIGAAPFGPEGFGAPLGPQQDDDGAGGQGQDRWGDPAEGWCEGQLLPPAQVTRSREFTPYTRLWVRTPTCGWAPRTSPCPCASCRESFMRASARSVSEWARPRVQKLFWPMDHTGGTVDPAPFRVLAAHDPRLALDAPVQRARWGLPPGTSWRIPSGEEVSPTVLL